MYSTPILLIVFNRPEPTQVVFDKIKALKPKLLYIAADGPRPDSYEDLELCNKTRKLVLNIDWNCEVKTLFRNSNLGCGVAVAEAITWFFKNVELGIIVEDDCVPNASFFKFCEELLLKYESNSNVMHISGSNLNDSIKFGEGTYYPSNYANVWGWATWKRAWSKFDFDMSNKDLYLKLIDDKFKYISEQIFWRSRLELIDSKKIDTWDYQWMFSIWREQGICLNTNFNLIVNIGFGPNATHTVGNTPYLTPTAKSVQEIIHPSQLFIIERAENEIVTRLHGIKKNGYLEYYFKKYFLQKCINLLHKIKLRNQSKY